MWFLAHLYLLCLCCHVGLHPPPPQPSKQVEQVCFVFSLLHEETFGDFVGTVSLSGLLLPSVRAVLSAQVSPE